MCLLRFLTRKDHRSSDNEIDVQVFRTEARTEVVVSGRVTVNSSMHLRSVMLRLLQKGSDGLVIIDLTRVSYIDTSGIATLLESLRTAVRRSVRLRVIGAKRGQVRLLAETVELADIFSAVGSEVVFS